MFDIYACMGIIAKDEIVLAMLWVIPLLPSCIHIEWYDVWCCAPWMLILSRLYATLRNEQVLNAYITSEKYFYVWQKIRHLFSCCWQWYEREKHALIMLLKLVMPMLVKCHAIGSLVFTIL